MNRSGTFTRRRFLQSAGGALATAAVGATLGPLARPARAADTAPAARNGRPDILLIMADDMGFSDIGCYGGEVRTPHIDGLAKRGIRFTQCYNNAKCEPTRASLLTGLYVQQVGAGPIKHSVTLGEVLRSAGYRTLMAGKWHQTEIPVRRGFDRYFGLADGCCNYWNPGEQREGEPPPGRKYSRWRRWAIDEVVYQPYTPEDRNFYTTDAFTDYALKYLDEYGKEDRPIFLYLAYTAPHYPLHARPEDIARYRTTYTVGWDDIRAQRFQRQVAMGLMDRGCDPSPRDPGVTPWADAKNKDEWALKMAVYAAMIDRMDQNIGRVLAKFQELGRLDNTLVVFLADNGGCAENVNKTPDIPPGPLPSYRTVDEPWANASNTPFRKYKTWDHEGGICTPFIATWPKVITKGGQINTRDVGHIIDIMATFCDVAGAEYPAEYAGRKVLPMEGKSLRPCFEGKPREGHDALYWEFGQSKAVRQGQWKLVKHGKDDWELYDMEADRCELRDLAKAQPDRVQTMAAMWDAWSARCTRDYKG